MIEVLIPNYEKLQWVEINSNTQIIKGHQEFILKKPPKRKLYLIEPFLCLFQLYNGSLYITIGDGNKNFLIIYLVSTISITIQFNLSLNMWDNYFMKYLSPTFLIVHIFDSQIDFYMWSTSLENTHII